MMPLRTDHSKDSPFSRESEQDDDTKLLIENDNDTKINELNEKIGVIKRVF